MFNITLNEDPDKLCLITPIIPMCGCWMSLSNMLHVANMLLLLSPTLSLIPFIDWFNMIYITVLHIQEEGETWHTGVPCTQTNHRMYRLSHAILPLGQQPSLHYFLSSSSSVSLSIGCHGELRMNTPLSLVTCPPHFLLCLPLSFYISSYFQVSSSITFSHSEDDLHMCLSVIMSVDMSRAYNIFWLSRMCLWSSFVADRADIWKLTDHTLGYMSPLLPLTHIKFFLSLLLLHPSPRSWLPSFLFSQLSSSSSQCSHLTEVPSVIRLESYAL